MLEKTVNEHDHLLSSLVGDTMNYFRKMIRDGRKSFAAEERGAKLLHKFFSSKLDDIEYQKWLADKLSLHDIEGYVEFSDCADLSEDENFIVGRKLLSLELRQQVYNFWKATNYSKRSPQ